jgi:hypothetical protein
MAFTATEKANIIFYLGYPAKTIVPDSTSYSNVIAGRLDNNSVDIETIARDLLAKIVTSRAEIELAKGRLKASKVEDITLNDREMRDRWKEDSKLCRMLGDHLDIPYCGNSSMVGVVV